jgi:hypothetical protein
VKSRYKDTPQWMIEPNGKPTNLNERQWVQVRTPLFKQYFGDWETAARVEAIKNIAPKEYKSTERTNRKDIKTEFGKIGIVTNRDGTAAHFPNTTAGKILYDKGFDTSTIIPHLKELYETAVFAYDENERDLQQRPDGSMHKKHPDVETYRNHVNKFLSEDGREYYIRFVTYIKKQTIKNKPVKTPPNDIHSTFVSEVHIYKDGAPPTSTSNTLGEGNYRKTTIYHNFCPPSIPPK